MRITEPLQCFDQGKINDHAAILIFRIPECQSMASSLSASPPLEHPTSGWVGRFPRGTAECHQREFPTADSVSTGSCGLSGDGRGFMQQFLDLSQPRIVWPKIVPPLTHTMSFINSQKFDLTTCQHIRRKSGFRNLSGVTYSSDIFPGQPLRIEPASARGSMTIDESCIYPSFW